MMMNTTRLDANAIVERSTANEKDKEKKATQLQKKMDAPETGDTRNAEAGAVEETKSKGGPRLP